MSWRGALEASKFISLPIHRAKKCILRFPRDRSLNLTSELQRRIELKVRLVLEVYNVTMVINPTFLAQRTRQCEFYLVL